jgi:hypothetical protein
MRANTTEPPCSQVGGKTLRHGFNGYVYFIAPEALLCRERGCEGAIVKIGHTRSHPLQRLKTLQTGSPMHLRLWAYVDGGRDLEEAFHRAFIPLHSHGEWFLCEHKLFSLMLRLGEEPDVGHYITHDELEGMIMDSVFSFCAPHPSMNNDDWLSSAYPSALAGFFPNAWQEAIR